MLKKYDEALSNLRKGSQSPDSSRGCNVFKLLKDEDYDGEPKDKSKGEPSKRKPSKRKPSKKEPSKGELSKGEPSKKEPSKEEPSKEEPSKEEPSKEEPSKKEPSKEEPSKEDPSKEKPYKGEPSKREIPKEEHSKGEPNKEELSEEKPTKRKVRKGKKRKPKIEDIDPDKEGVLEYHKMLVFSENLPSKDTQFNYKKDLEKKRKKKVAEDVPDTKPPAPVEEPKPEPVPAVEEPVQETTPEDGEKDMTESYAQDKFRDGVRRIDIVLVAVDDGEFLVTEERNRYLTNVLKAGLEIETSPGVMSMNRNLVFIKIHAPNSVLDEYNHAFGTKKYFRDDHLRFVNPSLTNYARLLPCTRVTHERELISLVRDQYEEPLRLSNAERSLIVYKILLELPYGNCFGTFGIDRLLSRRIFLDVFALHDGPHYIFPNQDWKTISARQFLFYNWVGKINAYKVHPLNLIREYFGERIGMFFAFYEFFNHALIIPAIFGVIWYYLAVNDTTDKYIVDDVCKNKNNSYICPRCNQFEACRFIKLTDLCKSAKLHKVLDSPAILYYMICLTVWAPAFYVFWRRKENFWIWLWELNTDRTKETYKPEYDFDCQVKPRSKLTGLLQNYVHGAEKEVRTFLIVVLWIVLIYRAPIYYITKYLENHLTYESQARSLMFKTFAASFLWTFPTMFYYAWIKGAEFYTPVRPENKHKLRLYAQFRGRYSFTHCGPFTCLDEVFFVLLATVLIRHIAIPFLVFFKGLIYNTMTDYNQGARVTKNVPSWEREYRLEPVTEAMMARKQNVLMMQFALVTLVGAAFPFAPLLILIRNFCDIRYEARMFVQCRRRPLLLGTGLGVWTPILQGLAFFTIPANALTLTRTTKIATRKTYIRFHGSMKHYLFYSQHLVDVTLMYTRYMNDTKYGMVVMWDSFNAYKKKNFVPKQCYYPSWFEDFYYLEYGDRPRIYMPPKDIRATHDSYVYRFEANILYLVFLVPGLVYAAVLNYAIRPYSSQLSIIMEIETRMKNAYIRMSKKQD
ncbi:anoctamin-6-like isoform X2 [Choristoneura fumiferana]|uniref:anoctamin-6-like isoform X2 n=1 Tax=Choristoneura fumiferana TaxID=7141 RepID=UPI003D154010